MARSKIYVGLEIGTTKVVMVVAETRPDHSVTILALGDVPSAGIKKGEICDYKKAKAAVKEALLLAEDKGDVLIKSLCLSVTGSHICSENHTGVFRLPDQEKEVTEEHISEVNDDAREIALPKENVYIHHIPRHYRLDGQEHSTVPFGLLGRTLEADYHIVHGISTRLQNSIKCVREIPLDVNDIVSAPICSAQVALRKSDRENGALMIDIGGGTSDFILYHDDAIVASGTVAAGGWNVSNDVHLMTHISFDQAEALKLSEGNAWPTEGENLGTVQVPALADHPETELKREMVNEIISDRMRDIFQLILERLPVGWEKRCGNGVYLTGGASLLRNLGHLADSMFEPPIYCAQSQEGKELSYYEDPRYATVLGLIRYAQFMDQEKPESQGSKFQDLVKSFWPF